MSYEENLFSIENFQKDGTICKKDHKKFNKVVEKGTNSVFTAIIFKINFNDNIIQNIKLFYDAFNYRKLKHHSVLQFIGFNFIGLKYKPNPTIITEFTDNISLQQLITNQISIKDQNFNFTKKIINIYGIASGINYLHKNNIIHRNLTPENIFLDQDLYPKITGFNIPDILQNNTKESRVEEDLQIDFNDNIYSFGIIVEKIVRESSPDENVNLNSYFKLINKCKSEDSAKRPKFDEIISDLENDKGFIINDVDVNEYNRYIQLIKNNDCIKKNHDIK